jgi:hypothetical protein
MVRPRAPFSRFVAIERSDYDAFAEASGELDDISECLQELIAVERRIADEVRRRRSRRALPTGRYDLVLSALARATASLQQAIEGAAAPISEAETICWQCNRPIVRGRLAEPSDVRRHLAWCDPTIG